MVLSRNDKRKRKEGDLVDLMDPLAEAPKRTKIHAQRKFAQGVATPTNVSPATTPVKEEEKEKKKVKPTAFTELITHKRPNTEDFLTFLCFRGTSILPPSLNFFSPHHKKEKSQNVLKSSSPSTHNTKANGTCGKSTTSIKNETKSSLSSSQKSAAKEKSANVSKKHATVPSKLKTTNTAVQALKKNYQEKRLVKLAKQRLNKKLKVPSVKTRSSAPFLDKLPEKQKIIKKKIHSPVENRRHGLRSTGLPESEKKSLPLKPAKKPLPQKLKKKLIIPKEQTTQKVSSVKDKIKKPPPKVLANKLIHKKLLKKSKTIATRRVTRSHTDTLNIETPISPTPGTLVKRPTRKTKEAATLYMEILGRKLVSPDLENDDNLSVDSFPELPNARKIAQTENEIKAKMKSLKTTVNNSNNATAKEKEKKSANTTQTSDNATKQVKKRILKNTLTVKNKRQTKPQKVSELNSEEESISSEVSEIKKARVAARRSFIKDKKPENRNLRSTRSLVEKVPRKSSPKQKESSQKDSSKETPKLTKSAEAQSSNKDNKESSNNFKEKEKSNKENQKEKTTTVTKRKREFLLANKEGSSKQKSETAKNKSRATSTESEEETLDTVLNKLKKQREIVKEEVYNEVAVTKKTVELKSIKTTTVEVLKSQALAERVTAKVSDDEESFHGFTKKSISKIVTTCQSHVKSSNLLEDIDSKINVLKTHDIPSTGLKDLKKTDVKTSSMTFICVKSTKISNEDVPKNSVKLEPDFGEMKVSSTSSATHNIIDMPKTLSHGRKERVNMSTEQIEKWLNESSLAKEESKVEMESVSNYKYDSPTLEKSKTDTLPIPSSPKHGHLSISPRIQHLVRPVNVTLSKLSDRLKKVPTTIGMHRMPTVFLANTQVSQVKPQVPTLMAKEKHIEIKEVIPEKKDIPNTPPARKMSKDSSFCEDAAESDAVSKSDAASVGDSSEKKSLSSPEKKVFFHQRKPFQPKDRYRSKIPSSSSAFSPENESSVYAFETEAEQPVNTPFRRKARESAVRDLTECTDKDKPPSTPSKSESKEKSVEEIGNLSDPLNSSEEAQKEKEKTPPLLERTTPKNFELPKNFADLTNVQVLPLDKLTTSWSNVNYSASIAVQVNLDDQKKRQQQQPHQSAATAESNESSANQKSSEISTQTENATAENEDDNDDSGQLFYIPLQAVTRIPTAQGGQQLIQGVAVKLGTEGPTGPNQRVLLKAKLVTKPPISVARCPPIGTVQPTTRTPQNTEQEAPSTSTPSSAGATGFKSPVPEEKNKSIAVTNKQIQKTLSPEKLIKSPRSKERRMSTDGKTTKRVQNKIKPVEVILPINKTTFPNTKLNESARLVEAPVFRPSEKEFQDPLEYIDKIRPIAEKFGICKVVPPSNFKPECKVSDDMRFTAYNQYIHRMLNRWGPNVKEMMAIKKYLATQSITLTQLPWIGGMEVDLPHLYQTVQNLGGLKEVIEKKRWQKVADGMKIPRSAQDRVTKLDDIYCKYLLPYDTLSQAERDKLFKDVEAEWAKREKKDRQETQSIDNEDDEDEDNTEELEECIVKGRNMPLNAFYRIARNTQRMWFGENQNTTNETEGASADEVETAFWRHVVEKKRHVCVHSASIDSSGRGFGFSVAKNSPFGRHPWNLKILTNNAGSVLRALGPQMGVTVPTLHVGMVFSTCCWYRDPHGLPWIEYLHTGAKKIWYGIPDEQNNTFRKALTKMFPRYCKNKTIWLPSDTAMVPPDMLVSHGVPLCQTVQEPGQFIVVFPKAFTSSICTGYVVSESVYFAQPSWLETAEQVFQDLHDSCEPSIFSFERLLFSIINDTRSHIDVLKQILPTVIKVCDLEIENRKKIKDLGLTNTEKLPLPESDKKGKAKKVQEEEGDYECDTCRANLFVSLVSNSSDEGIFCLTHAIQYIEKKKQVLKNCTLLNTYSESELNDLVHKLKERIEAKSKKTNQTKHAK